MDENCIIKEKLKDIEKEYGITVLFCVEAGSRVWRLDSANSDYDIRFVYYYPFERYLGLTELPDSINITYDISGTKTKTNENVMYDFLGFDIYKFAALLLKSNPSAVEWMESDITYFGSKPQS